MLYVVTSACAFAESVDSHRRCGGCGLCRKAEEVRKVRKSTKRNTKLLSFGEEAEAEEAVVASAPAKIRWVMLLMRVLSSDEESFVGRRCSCSYLPGVALLCCQYWYYGTQATAPAFDGTLGLCLVQIQTRECMVLPYDSIVRCCVTLHYVVLCCVMLQVRP